MTVIFQLFSVDDIRMLGPHGPERLLEFMKSALEHYKTTQPHIAQSSDEPPKFVLEASNETSLKSEDKTPPQVIDAIQKRFEEVSKQLISSPPEDPTDSSQLNPRQPLFPQLSDQHPRQRGVGGEADNTILQWAISCEVNNFNFYFPLLQVKEQAYKWFFNETGQRPKGPDSLYSPFNPLHPLYSLYYYLETEVNPPEAQEGSKSS